MYVSNQSPSHYDSPGGPSIFILGTSFTGGLALFAGGLSKPLTDLVMMGSLGSLGLLAPYLL